jgi:hypothetical protein
MLTRKALIPGGTTEMMEASSNDTASPERNSGGARNSWAGRDPISGHYWSRPMRTKLNFITQMLVTGAAAAAIAAAPTEAAESGRFSQ